MPTFVLYCVLGDGLPIAVWQAIWARSRWVSLPFQQLQADPRERALIVGVYLAILLPFVSALRGESAGRYVRSVHKSRHASVDRHSIESGVSMRGVQCVDLASATGQWSEAAVRMGLHSKAREVAAVLDRRENGRAFARLLARELLADYIEEIASWAVGPEGVGDFLACLGEHIDRIFIGVA